MGCGGLLDVRLFLFVEKRGQEGLIDEVKEIVGPDGGGCSKCRKRQQGTLYSIDYNKT